MEGQRGFFSITGAALIAGPLLFAQGCLATRDWVNEQMEPVSARVSRSEVRINQAESQLSGLGSRLTGIEGNIGQFDGRLGQIDGKAEKALSAVANLRLERKLVINFRDGANFAFNSAMVQAEAKKEIDSFLSDLKGDLAPAESSIFLVAGHTDNQGPEDYNYDLGRRRADGVARYLLTQKSIDPLRVMTVSYGKNNPTADNNTPQGRAQNRRVEIMVYRDSITSMPEASAKATPGSEADQAAPAGEALTRR